MFYIPTLRELVERARRALRDNVPGTDAWLWPNNGAVMAKVVGGLTAETMAYADYIAKQRFAVTADSDNLDLHGEEVSLGRRSAESASGYASITHTAAIDILPGARFSRTDGVTYEVVEGYTALAAGSALVEIACSVTGKTGNAISGTPLDLLPDNVTNSGTVTATVDVNGCTGGADQEDDESYRARILFKKGFPPAGGSPADYVSWAMQVPGVSRVYVEKLWAGNGTVRVFVLMDDYYTNGIPPQSEIDKVKLWIDAFAPAGAIVTVVAPVAFPINVTISSLNPATDEVKNAVIEEMRLAIERHGRVSGITPAHPSMDFLASPLTFSTSWLVQAIANTSGEVSHKLVSPVADFAVPVGYIPTLGTVTFT